MTWARPLLSRLALQGKGRFTKLKCQLVKVVHVKREFAPDPAEEEAKRLREELAADKERRAKEKVEAGEAFAAALPGRRPARVEAALERASKAGVDDLTAAEAKRDALAEAAEL